jgi:hypothetical protein
MRADLLASAPDGFDEAIAAVDAFDQALVAGLVRPQPAQAAGLAQLAEAVAGTPLASRVAEAAEKAAAGVAGEDHFVALAAARTALLGAAHDALMAQVQEATGRPASAAEAARATGSEAPNAFGRLPDPVLLPWLPALITTLRSEGAELAPLLIREAGRIFPGQLPALDAWVPPWRGGLG